MSSRPWYQFFPADYLADTRLLTLEEHGAYRLLLDALWMHGPIDDSDVTRARLMSVSVRKSRVIWPRLVPFFELENGTFDHKKIAKQRTQASEIIEKKRAAAESRWRSKRNADAYAPANADATNARSARARPDPQPHKDPPLSASALPLEPPARARESAAGLTDEQRQQASAIQAALEQRREAEHVNGGGGPVKLRAVLPKSESGKAESGFEKKAGEDT